MTLPSPPPFVSPLRIMLLDDDAFMLDVLRDMLAELGQLDVVAASDARRALATLRDHAPELLICDLSMPDMDGIEFLGFAAQDGYAGSVMLLTGMEAGVRRAAERLARAHGLNVLGAYTKPLGQAELCEALARVPVASLPEASLPEAALAASAPATLTLAELRAGLAEQRVQLHYQPKVTLGARSSVAGAECLARWRQASGGMLAPAAFLPLLEQSSLIDDFTFLVLQQAAAQLGQWQRQGHDFQIGVNLAPANLLRADLPEVFLRIARAAGVALPAIVFEIDPARLPAPADTAWAMLARLRQAGFGVALTQAAGALGAPPNWPLSEWKFDGSGADGARLAGSVQAGKGRALTTVAERVETRADWERAADAGCDQVQGFFIAHPMPASDLLAWKHRWENRSADAQAGLAVAK